MNRTFLIFFLFLSLVILGYFYSYQNVEPILKYFPLENEVFFESANTQLKAKNEHEPCIFWIHESKTNKSIYLRQDVSLLYANSKLIGIKNLWKERAQKLAFKEKVCTNKNTIFHSVSFIHGEVHRKNQITSLYDILEDHLILLHTNTKTFKTFQRNDGFKKPFIESITNQLDKKLSHQLHLLLSYFQIDEQEYYSIPLIYLSEAYDNDLLPLPKEFEEQILGQLLEGLYQNYIIPSAEEKVIRETSIPFILFSKDQTHLQVVFILNHQYEQLIQHYPV